MFRLPSCWCGFQALKYSVQKYAIVSCLKDCGIFADLSLLILFLFWITPLSTIWMIFPIANTVKDVIWLENTAMEKVPSVLCCTLHLVLTHCWASSKNLLEYHLLTDGKNCNLGSAKETDEPAQDAQNAMQKGDVIKEACVLSAIPISIRSVFNKTPCDAMLVCFAFVLQ